MFTIDTVFLQTLYVIVVIELGSRRLLHANCTANPDFHWMTQQALNVVYELQDQPVPVRFALRDRDAKFTSSFDAVLEAEDIKVIRTPYRAPLANSHCERAIGSARREFFDFVIVVGESHLRRLLDLGLIITTTDGPIWLSSSSLPSQGRFRRRVGSCVSEC